MVIDPNLVLPPVETPKPILSNEANLDTAFYTAGSSSQNPVEDFNTIATDLNQRGQSEMVDNAMAAWEKEQDLALKDTIKSFIEDPSVSKDQKRDVLELYATGGYFPKDLKDKYVQKVAATEVGITHKDREAQDEVVNNLQSRLTKIAAEQQKEDILNSESTILNATQATGSTILDIGTGAIAGIAGVIQAVSRLDALSGQDLAREWSQILQHNPNDPNVARMKESIMDKLSYLGVPARKVEEILINSGVSGGTALTTSVVADPVNLIPAGAAFRLLKRSRRGLGPRVRPDSPINNTIAANPAVAKDFIEDAITDPTESVATSFGSTKAALINEFALPKPLSKEDLKSHPDLAKDIIAKDSEVIDNFMTEMFDPNLQDATKRLEDINATYQLLQEARGPVYKQSLSSLIITDNVFEGKAILGPNNVSPYSGLTDVVNGFSVFDAKRKSLPLDQQGSLFIVDINTGIKYTPESLKADPRWHPTTREITEEIPGPRRTKATIESEADFKKSLDTRLAAIEAFVKDKAAKKELKSKSTSKDLTKKEITSLLTEMKDKETLRLTEERNAKIADNTKIDTEVVPNVKVKKEVQVASAEPKQFYLEWNWKKEYDELSMRLFGKEAVKTTILGRDVSALARSKVGNYIFGTGRFPTWFESSALRMSERAAKRSALILDTVRSKIANTTHPKELSSLITEAEAKGIAYFSQKDVATRFPNLSVKDANNLFENYVYWRRVNEWNWSLANYQYINQLYREGFTKGLYLDNRYIGPANDTFSFAHRGLAPKKAWDFEKTTGVDVKILPSKKNEGSYDTSGKKLVQLKKPMTDANGDIFEFALVDDSVVKLNILPKRVLPHIPGYSPIKTEAHFFIDVIPKKAVINGIEVTDANRLETHVRTLASAKTQYEADILETEFKERYPDHRIKVRPDREASFGRILNDAEAHDSLLRNAMQRGEGLEGTGTIEDRLITLVDTTQSLARQNAMRSWEEATKESFVKDYSKFLKEGKFPESTNDIIPRPGMGREDLKEFKEANRVFEYYAKLKSFSSWGDEIWKNVFHGLADVFEKFKIPANLVRDFANKGNLLVEVPKQVASTLFIHLNPPKQWILQPSQLYEMYLVYPETALKNFGDLGALRVALASRSPIFKGKATLFEKMAQKAAPGMDKIEFEKTIKAIEESGLLQSIDHNLLVHGVFDDVSRGLVEGSWTKAYHNLLAAPKAVVRGARSVGFDFAELTNRMGLWLQVRDIWKSRNPGKDWNTLEVKEYIALESNKLAGAMNKAGALPYQKGALSVLFQFAAISQKQTLNLLQDNATLLSKERRYALAAARAALWGTKSGIIGGAAIYYYIDRSENEEIQKNAEVLKVGLADRIFNLFLRSITDSEYSQVTLASSMSPYGNSTIGLPVDVIYEMTKLIDDKPTSPRYPAFGAIDSIQVAINNFQSYFVVNEITPENAAKAFYESMSIASGMNNWAKAQLMWSAGIKLTKNGSDLGMQFSHAEAVGQALGLLTRREETSWEVLNSGMSLEAEEREMASQIYTQLLLIKKRSGDPKAQIDYSAMNSFISVLGDDAGEWPQSRITRVVAEVLKLDKRSYTEVQSSILMDMIQKGLDASDQNTKYLIPKLKSIASTGTEKDKAILELIEVLENRGKL